MIAPRYFDMIDRICKEIRDSDEPFGGIQMVISGDFLQLPPVDKTSEIKLIFNDNNISPDSMTGTLHSSLAKSILGGDYDQSIHGGYLGKIDDETSFLFESKAWKHLMKNGMTTIMLEDSFRQTDKDFVAFLDDLRVGKYDEG
jgi:hypothetical protein